MKSDTLPAYMIYTSGEDDRIMYGSAAGGDEVRTNCPTNGNEVEAYEVGNGGPPER